MYYEKLRADIKRLMDDLASRPDMPDVFAQWAKTVEDSFERPSYEAQYAAYAAYHSVAYKAATADTTPKYKTFTAAGYTAMAVYAAIGWRIEGSPWRFREAEEWRDEAMQLSA